MKGGLNINRIISDDSILNTTKKLIGIAIDDDSFDADIILSINSVFMILNQLGVGPDKPFRIEDAGSDWTEFLDGSTDVDAVKTYMQQKVKLMFDPPDKGVLHEALERQVQELEWRLAIQAESFKKGGVNLGL